MKVGTLRILALVTTACLGLDVHRTLLEEAGRPEPEVETDYRYDSEVRRLAPFSGAELMLRVALLRMARDDNLEAIIDAIEVPLISGEAFELELSFSTADHSRLPGALGNFQIQIDGDGVFHGSSGDLHLLTFEKDRRTTTVWEPGGYGSSGGQAQFGSFAMETGIPISIVEPHRRTALFMVILPAEEQAGGDAGQMDYWRNLFRSAAALDPLPDRSAIYAAADALQPMRRGRPLASSNFRTHGPLLDAAFAAYALRDHEQADRIRDWVREDPGLIGRIARAGIPRDMGVSRVWIGLDTRYSLLGALFLWLGIQPVRDALRGDFTAVGLQEVGDWQQVLLATLHASHLRTLERSEDPALLAELEKRLGELSGYGNFPLLKRFVLTHERFGRTAAAQDAWQRVREQFLGTMNLPWKWLYTAPNALFLYLLAIPFLALVPVLVPRNFRASFPPRLSWAHLLWLAILSFLTLEHFPLRTLLVPVWWALAWRWMRFPVSHPWWERLSIWLALSLSSIDALHTMSLYATGPLFELLSGSSRAFCWLLVGRLLVADPAWPRSDSFKVFLICLCGTLWLPALEAELLIPPVVAVSFLALLVFLVTVRPTPRDPATGLT